MEKTQVILNQDNTNDLEMETEEVVNEDKNVTKKKAKNDIKTGGKPKSTNIVPIVTQNSKSYDLN